jgi:hypothetical protein
MAWGSGRHPQARTSRAGAAKEAPQRKLRLRATSRFLHEYEKASAPLQGLVEQEVRNLRRRFKASSNWTKAYRTAKGFSERVIELELGGGHRALAHPGGSTVTLLSMGDHEATTRLRRVNLRQTLAETVRLPRQFTLGGINNFFPESTDAPTGLARFANEFEPEWLYFLDERQASICADITSSIEELLLREEDDAHEIHLIIGGPGTGKSSILLQLLMRLSKISGGKECWDVGLSVSDQLADYIGCATGWDLSAYRSIAKYPVRTQVLLVDDPSSVREIKQTISLATTSTRLRAVIIAFDPLQLGDSLSDADFGSLLRMGARQHLLMTCYRQKEAVGRAAMETAQTIASSSPFLDERKRSRFASERRLLTDLSNGLVFRNESGYATSYPSATRADWLEHISWMRTQKGLWKHWPPVLLVVDPLVELPPSWRSELSRLQHREVTLQQAQTIKGLEFQHALILISDRRYQDIIDGFTGSGRHLYNDYRLLRIPFTRAKDSLAIFVRQG